MDYTNPQVFEALPLKLMVCTRCWADASIVPETEGRTLDPVAGMTAHITDGHLVIVPHSPQCSEAEKARR